MREGDELVVDFAGYAVDAELGVEGEGHIEHRRTGREGEQLPLGGKDDNLCGEEVEFEGVEEVDSVGRGVVEDVLDCLEPDVELTLLLVLPYLVFPMGGKALFGYLVHAARANLHLYPVAVGAHKGDVERLVAVGFGICNPVAGAVGMRAVEVGEGRIELETHLLFGHPFRRVENYAHGVEIVDLLEGNMLGVHLAPYRVDRFEARLGLVLQPHSVEALENRRGEVVVDHLAAGLALGNEAGDALIFPGVLIFEAQILQLGLYGEETEAVGEGGVDIEGLAGNLILLVGGHRAEGAHVVEAVGHLDEHHSDVLAHGEEEFAEILGLCRSLVAKDTARNLGQTLDYAGNLTSEVLLYVLDGIFGVLDDIVEQRGAYRRGAEAYLLRGNLGHGYGVDDIRLARAAPDALVGLLGETEGTLDDLYLLAVVAREVAVEQIPELLLDMGIFLLGSKIIFLHCGLRGWWFRGMLCTIVSEIFVAVGELGIVDHLLDSLLLGFGADEEDVVGVGDDIVLQTLHDHELFGTLDGEDVAVALVGEDVAVLSDVGIAVAGRVVIERAPCSEVVPAEADTLDVDILGLLHNGVVD